MGLSQEEMEAAELTLGPRLGQEGPGTRILRSSCSTQLEAEAAVLRDPGRPSLEQELLRRDGQAPTPCAFLPELALFKAPLPAARRMGAGRRGDLVQGCETQGGEVRLGESGAQEEAFFSSPPHRPQAEPSGVMEGRVLVLWALLLGRGAAPIQHSPGAALQDFAGGEAQTGKGGLGSQSRGGAGG